MLSPQCFPTCITTLVNSPRPRCCVPCLHDIDETLEADLFQHHRAAEVQSPWPVGWNSCTRTPRSFAATESSNARCSEWGSLPPDVCRILLANEGPDACRMYEDQERSRAGNFESIHHSTLREIHQRLAFCGHNGQGLSLIVSVPRRFYERKKTLFVVRLHKPWNAVSRVCTRNRHLYLRFGYASSEDPKGIDYLQGLDSFVTQAAGGGPLLYTSVPSAAAAFSPPDRLFHAAPMAQCAWI